MSIKTRWANIICNQKMQPYKMIVTDGLTTSEIPISNTQLSNVKRWAYEVYNVPHKNILITQVMDESATTETP
jgi:hypothetical protein